MLPEFSTTGVVADAVWITRVTDDNPDGGAWMRARDRGRAVGQIVALGVALAVICAAAPGTAAAEPAAQQQPPPQQQPPQQKRVFKIVVVGDSYSSGEGIHGPNNG